MKTKNRNLLDLKIAAAQINPTVGDIVGNTRKILQAWEKARADQADLLITPELSLLGYNPEDLVKKADVITECREALSHIARATKGGPSLIVGAPILENGVIYNAGVHIGGGVILDIIKKQDLPNYGVFDDKRLFGAGGEQRPILVHGVKIGVLICEDTWSPRAAASLKDKGAELLISINASPYEYNKEKTIRMDAVKARSRETELPIIYLNQVGGQDGVVYDGHSFALNSDRSIAWKAPGWIEHQDVITFSYAGRKTTLKGPGEGESASWGSGQEQLYTALVLGTRDYMKKNGFEKAVIGLSGGADSALVAAIAADAIGAANIMCLRLPSPITSRASMDDAEEVAKRLGCEIRTIPIADTVSAISKTLTEQFREMSGLTRQNIQARARGLILMGVTNQFRHHLLLTTGNKSEMCVGYTTLYGDMSGGFNPIKDVYKTTLFELMEWRNLHKPALGLGPATPVIPQSIIKKKPSAELEAGQTDETDLGSYNILDPVLEHLIEKETPIADIVAEGYPADYVQKISDLVDRAEYKRRQAAPGNKVTRRALFGDRRYPITNGFRSSRRLIRSFVKRLDAA